MSNYYEQKIVEIELLIKKNEEQAFALLREELSMPYIPLAFKKQFQKMLETIAYKKISKVEDGMNLSSDSIIAFLFSGDYLKESTAIDHLPKVNLHKIAPELKQWIEKSPKSKNISKAFIFESLIEQSVDIMINFNGQSMNPAQSKSKLENEIVLQTVEQIEQLASKEPQISTIAISELQKYLLIVYPKVWKDASEMSKAFVNIVKKMFGQAIELSKLENSLISKLSK